MSNIISIDKMLPVAVVETGGSVAAYAEPCDTVSFCFSKGLGTPVGSILVGDTETIKIAHRFRKMIGSGMSAK